MKNLNEMVIVSFVLAGLIVLAYQLIRICRGPQDGDYIIPPRTKKEWEESEREKQKFLDEMEAFFNDRP